MIKKVLTGALAITIIGTSATGFAITHSVQSGETYWKISQKYNVDINDLLGINNADEYTVLNIGDEIKIPDYQSYSVQSGDTLWIISNKFNVSLNELMTMNNLDENSEIRIGQPLKIPIAIENNESLDEGKYYIVEKNDTPWIISEKLNVSFSSLLETNNLSEDSTIYIGQKLIIPNSIDDTKDSITIDDIKQPNVTVTYDIHTVKSGDTFWKIANQYGVTVSKILEVNNANEKTSLDIGDEVKVPVYNIPIMDTLGQKYGEYLDWWKGSQYLIPIGTEMEVTDFYTGKSFMLKRTTGANHADVETLTYNDTEVMKSIWGGNLDWEKRPVIIELDGRRIAASLAGKPHAGNDKALAGEYTSWRSGDYGSGINFDYIKDNGADGHFDLHFYNSTRHKDGQVDDIHQRNVKIAAGIIK
ncbi:LysM peptidoglycan-binding domain-containing protein [Dethiothermospora halolimnae]|uniref:LysM peptidoglycan-binding domain-containing protein n=1 Tax=Dethiothermospora halolimnae TaxID=3114390 RepID=UPI003CCC1230